MQAMLLVLLSLSTCADREAGARSITQDVVIDNSFPVGSVRSRSIQAARAVSLDSTACGGWPDVADAFLCGWPSMRFKIFASSDKLREQALPAPACFNPMPIQPIEAQSWQ
jgi:hypothetical protein